MPYIAYLPNSRVTLLDLDEVAEVLNVSRKTAYRYCKSGKLPSNSVSGQVMVSEETLLAFLHGAKPQKSAARTRVSEERELSLVLSLNVKPW